MNKVNIELNRKHWTKYWLNLGSCLRKKVWIGENEDFEIGTWIYFVEAEQSFLHRTKFVMKMKSRKVGETSQSTGLSLGKQKENTPNNRFVISVPTVNLIECKKVLNIWILKEMLQSCRIWGNMYNMPNKSFSLFERSESSTKILALSTTNRENVIYSS